MSENRDFVGVPIRVGSLHDAAAEILERSNEGAPSTTYRLVNAYTLALADKDSSYHDVLCGPGVNFPDGRPLAKVLTWTHRGIDVEQVRGPSLFEACLDHGRAYGTRHYLLGGTPGTLTQLTEQIEQRFPGAIVVAADSPPFRTMTEIERADQLKRIRNTAPHVVWVGLGTPKQDFEALQLLRETSVTTVAVGAAFDFTAGTVPQAPAWLRRAGLEWVFRLAAEPRRLWRRYLFGNARFVGLSMRHLFRALSTHRG